MYITLLNRAKTAPFDLFAENQKPDLIPDEHIVKLEELTWENLSLKRQCLEFRTQPDFRLKKIPNIPKYQEHARNTANLYLNKYAIKINEAYAKTYSFCRNYLNDHAKELKHLSKNLSDGTNRNEFRETIKQIKTEVREIKSITESLKNMLPKLRTELEEDTRNFQMMIEDADELISSNTIEVDNLKSEIITLETKLNYLNKAIPGYASMTGLGFIGLIAAAIVGGLMIAGTLGTATPAVIAVGVGLAAGSGMGMMGSAKMYDFINEKKEKDLALKKANTALAKLEKENTIATNLKALYDPWVKNINLKLTAQVQNLYEGWNQINENFTSVVDKINDALEKTKLDSILNNTAQTVKDIEEIIKRHEKSKYITSKEIKFEDELLLSSLNIPSYYASTSSKVIKLPPALAVAFANKNRQQ